MTMPPKPRGNTGTRPSEGRSEMAQPAKVFSDPKQVLVDPTLSTHEKRQALDSLEQDARQLAVATAEGMDGGEQTTLHNVLQAKRSLDEGSSEGAFSQVLRTFEEQLPNTLGTEAHALIAHAIDAIHAARDAIAERHNAAIPPPGAPEAGSQKELKEEIDKEKLDPGA